MDKTELEKCIKDLQNEDIYVKILAGKKISAAVLANEDISPAIPQLIKSLSDEHPDFLWLIVWIFRQCISENIDINSAIPSLIKVLSYKQVDAKSEAGKTLLDFARKKKGNAKLIIEQINKSKINKELLEVKELIRKCNAVIKS